jgi:hypothetical protein
MTLSKVQNKDMGYAKEEEKNGGEIKACSKPWFGHLQVQEKIAHIQKKRRERDHTNIKEESIHKSTKFPHLHILIRLHDLFLLGSFEKQLCLFIPTLSSIEA